MCKGTSLRECEKLDGASNFVPWKLRLQLLMDDDAEVDSRFAFDGSIVEYKDNIVGFS
jgi:hypothetical protein